MEPLTTRRAIAKTEAYAISCRKRKKAFSTGLLNAVSAQIPGRQPDELAMLVQPPRHGLQLAADLVTGEEIE